MCIHVTLLCPWCGADSGKTEIEPCRRNPCVGEVTLEHFMLAEHLQDWFCATDICPYTEARRRAVRDRFLAIKAAQAAGKIRPDDDYDDDGDDDEEMEDADRADDSDDGSDDMDVDGGAGAEPGEADGERPAAGAAPFAPGVDANPAPAVRQGGAARALPVFDQATSDRIAQLRQEIARSAPPGNRWTEEEDELLLLLRRHGVTYVQMAANILTRHPANGCESRGSVLGRRQRGA